MGNNSSGIEGHEILLGDRLSVSCSPAVACSARHLVGVGATPRSSTPIGARSVRRAWGRRRTRRTERALHVCLRYAVPEPRAGRDGNQLHTDVVWPGCWAPT